MTQPDIDIADLRAKAEAATPGPWTTGDCGDIYYDEETPGGAFLLASTENGDRQSAENCTFIAAANPSVVLALLDRLAAAEAELAMALVRISNQQFQNDNLRENLRAMKAKEEGMSEVWKALAEEGIIA